MTRSFGSPVIHFIPDKVHAMPPVPDAILGRHARAIRILTCLQSGPGFNAAELARHLGVSRRTIYRDLNLIKEAGIHICFDERQSAYRLERDSQQHLIPTFEIDDLCDLLLTSHTSIMNRSPELHSEARQAMSKLLCLYPAETRNRLSRMISGCFVSLPEPAYGEEDWRKAKLILEAIGRQVCIRTSTLGDHGQSSTKIAPYRLDIGIDTLLLTGRSSYDAAKVTFPLESLVDIELTDDPFPSPRAARFLSQEIRQDEARSRRRLEYAS
jgi:predicted DNA-binding transcriptional regulator YafY